VPGDEWLSEWDQPGFSCDFFELLKGYVSTRSALRMPPRTTNACCLLPAKRKYEYEYMKDEGACDEAMADIFVSGPCTEVTGRLPTRWPRAEGASAQSTNRGPRGRPARLLGPYLSAISYQPGCAMDTWIHLDTPTAIESQDTPVGGHACMRIHLCYAYPGGCSIRNILEPVCRIVLLREVELYIGRLPCAPGGSSPEVSS